MNQIEFSNLFICSASNCLGQLFIFWKLSNMAIYKPCEQRLPKTFYFGPPIFVGVLNGVESPHEFLLNFIKCFRASIKFHNYSGPLCNYRKYRQGGFREFLFFSPAQWRPWHWRHAATSASRCSMSLWRWTIRGPPPSLAASLTSSLLFPP